MKRFKRVVYGMLKVGIVALLVGAVLFLWNLLIPSITGWSEINYWQALGLMVLGRLLVGGGIARKRNSKDAFHKDLHDAFDGLSKEEKKERIKAYFSAFDKK